MFGRADTELMRRFRAAGLVSLGVTTTPEMGLSFATEPVKYGPARNPWDLERGAGGSSGGAAALVAVPIAHGNDGAGSLRIPASCCGLVGLKPSRGRIPCGPDAAEVGFGTSTDFVLVRTVRDAALLLDLLHGPAPGDKYLVAPPLRPHVSELEHHVLALRIAVTTAGWFGAEVDPEVADAVRVVAATLEQLGHHVESAAPPVDEALVLDSQRRTIVAMAAPFLLAPRPPDPGRMEAMSRVVIAAAEQTTAIELIVGLEGHNRISRQVAPFFHDYDVLLTPTLRERPVVPLWAAFSSTVTGSRPAGSRARLW